MVDVNKDESFIDIFFKLQLEWFDKGLTFKFLKYSENELPFKENDEIWKPEIYFNLIKTSTENPKDQIFISRRTSPGLARDEITEIYQGQSNSLNLVKLTRMIFVCSFDSTNYPFGKAADCKIDFFLPGVSNNLTDLKPRLVNEGPSTFGQSLLEKLSGEHGVLCLYPAIQQTTSSAN